jgi:hypothetical protein
VNESKRKWVNETKENKVCDDERQENMRGTGKDEGEGEGKKRAYVRCRYANYSISCSRKRSCEPERLSWEGGVHLETRTHPQDSHAQRQGW